MTDEENSRVEMIVKIRFIAGCVFICVNISHFYENHKESYQTHKEQYRS